MSRSNEVTRGPHDEALGVSSRSIEIYTASPKFKKEESERKKREQEAARESD
jgi:hypothetical protein